MDDRYPSTDERQSVMFDMPYPDAKNDLNRWLPLVKWILAIPHYVVLLFLWHRGLLRRRLRVVRDHLHRPLSARRFRLRGGGTRWYNRVLGYAFALVTDEYPPFRLSP